MTYVSVNIGTNINKQINKLKVYSYTIMLGLNLRRTIGNGLMQKIGISLLGWEFWVNFDGAVRRHINSVSWGGGGEANKCWQEGGCWMLIGVSHCRWHRGWVRAGRPDSEDCWSQAGRTCSTRREDSGSDELPRVQPRVRPTRRCRPSDRHRQHGTRRSTGHRGTAITRR